MYLNREIYRLYVRFKKNLLSLFALTVTFLEHCESAENLMKVYVMLRNTKHTNFANQHSYFCMAYTVAPTSWKKKKKSPQTPFSTILQFVAASEPFLHYYNIELIQNCSFQLNCRSNAANSSRNYILNQMISFESAVLLITKAFLSPPVQHARWAHIHHILSICRLSLDPNSLNNNSYIEK